MPKELFDLTFSAPGSLGLNTRESGQDLDFRWLIETDNTIIDRNNLLAARKGNKRQLTTAITNTPTIQSMFEYVDKSGNTLLIFTGDNKIWKDNGNGTATAITGTITTPTADNWKFQNFNGNCVGFQTGHSPIVITTVSGNFANISLSGTAQPSSSVNEVLAAFGRLWVLDGTDLKYSDALSHTGWNNLFDLTTVWISGMDIGTALTEFNGFLVIFGQNSIVVYNNPWVPTGSGTVDIAGMSLVENLQGIGCTERDSIQKIGTDVLFLSRTGVQSLGRTIQEKSMPDRDFSRNVRDHLLSEVANESLPIKSIFMAKEGYYLLSLPNTGEVYCFDTRVPLEDGSLRVNKWNTTVYSMAVTQDNSTYFGQANGWFSKYLGYKDNVAYDGSGGDNYSFHAHTGWNPLNEELADRIKILKKLSVYAGSATTEQIIFHWAVDYIPTYFQRPVTFQIATGGAVYGTSLYGTGEYGNALDVQRVKTSVANSSRVFSFGWHVEIKGGEFYLQNFSVQIKVGKKDL